MVSAPTEQAQACINRCGVVQPATARFDFGKRQCRADRGSIGAVRCHGLNDVRNRDDPCLEQDLLALESSRITAAVKALVMLSRRLGKRPRKIYALENGESKLGMLLGTSCAVAVQQKATAIRSTRRDLGSVTAADPYR